MTTCYVTSCYFFLLFRLRRSVKFRGTKDVGYAKDLFQFIYDPKEMLVFQSLIFVSQKNSQVQIRVGFDVTLPLFYYIHNTLVLSLLLGWQYKEWKRERTGCTDSEKMNVLSYFCPPLWQQSPQWLYNIKQCIGIPLLNVDSLQPRLTFIYIISLLFFIYHYVCYDMPGYVYTFIL